MLATPIDLLLLSTAMLHFTFALLRTVPYALRVTVLRPHHQERCLHHARTTKRNARQSEEPEIDYRIKYSILHTI